MKNDDNSSPTGRPRVFVMQQGPHDYSPAQPFGDLDVIRGGQLTPNAPDTTWNDGAIHAIRRSLMEYVPGVDFLIPTGDPVRMSLIGMLAAQRGSLHQLLGWDARAQRYLKFILDIKDIIR